MKSNKQRRLEIKTRRRKRAQVLKASPYGIYNYRPLIYIEADPLELGHNSYYQALPSYYADRPFECRDCGANEIWKAASQKWWYEIAKGYIDSTAVHCRDCRIKRKREKQQQELHMAIMAKQAPHPNEVFFRKRY
jgi:hypothetical protein